MKNKDIEYQKYFFAQQELERSYKFLDYLINNKMHNPLPKGKNKSIQQEAFTISFIVTYAKLFTNNNGFGMLSLKEWGLTQEQKNVHGEIIRLRHDAFSHLSSEIHECKVHKDFIFIQSPFIAISEKNCLILKEIIETGINKSRFRLTELEQYAPQYK